nr:response regulator [Betaproteobacteria bacterium]
MISSTAEFQEKMLALAESFAEKLPEKTHEIESLWKQLQIEWDAETLRTLHRLVHGLTGSGKTFGYPQISVIARSLEQTLKSLVQENLIADEELSAEIQQQVHELKIISSGSKPQFDHKSIFVPNKDSISHTSTSKQIFVVDDDAEAAEELVLQLSYYGYEVEAFHQLKEFRKAIDVTPNATVLMQVEFPEDKMAGIKAMQEIQKNREWPIQVIFISAYDDLSLRLGAVCAGSLAYFTKPINSTELIDQLDSLTVPQEQESFRVLIVDNSQTVLSYHAAILEQAGMTVKTVQNPMVLMEVLLEFAPDIVLMDIYMPNCSGIDLAKVIRQLGNFVSIPIV